MPAKSVFISHSSKDDAIVRELRQALSDLGIETWADSERLSGGDPLAAVIREEIENADYFLVLVSLTALNSEWVQREIAHAKSLRKRIVPLTSPRSRSADRDAAVRRRTGRDSAGQRRRRDRRRVTADSRSHRRTSARGNNPARSGSSPRRSPTSFSNSPTLQSRSSRENAARSRLPDWFSLRLRAARWKASATGLRRRSAPSRRERSNGIWSGSSTGPRSLSWSGHAKSNRPCRNGAAQLYDSVNAEPARAVLDAWSADRRGRTAVHGQGGSEQLIAGTPPEKQKEADEAATLLLGLPWELIHDEHGYLFQGARPVRVRRGLPNSDRQRAVATEPPIRVLLVSPRPEDQSAAYIDHRISARPLVEALSRLGHLASLKLLETANLSGARKGTSAMPVSAGEPYHVVHFDGHGVYDRTHSLGKLCFEDPSDLDKLEGRRSQLIDADRIARIVRDHRIPLFFLEACQTAQADRDPSASVAARLLESGVASVAAMSHSVLVETASRFISEFYRELLRGNGSAKPCWPDSAPSSPTPSAARRSPASCTWRTGSCPCFSRRSRTRNLCAKCRASRWPRSLRRRRELALGDLPEEPPHQFSGAEPRPAQGGADAGAGTVHRGAGFGRRRQDDLCRRARAMAGGDATVPSTPPLLRSNNLLKRGRCFSRWASSLSPIS